MGVPPTQVMERSCLHIFWRLISTSPCWILLKDPRDLHDEMELNEDRGNCHINQRFNVYLRQGPSLVSRQFISTKPEEPENWSMVFDEAEDLIPLCQVCLADCAGSIVVCVWSGIVSQPQPQPECSGRRSEQTRGTENSNAAAGGSKGRNLGSWGCQSLRRHRLLVSPAGVLHRVLSWRGDVQLRWAESHLMYLQVEVHGLPLYHREFVKANWGPSTGGGEAARCESSMPQATTEHRTYALEAHLTNSPSSSTRSAGLTWFSLSTLTR
jgi:hypothetical protein